MPEIGVVQKPGLFEDLLKRLGVNRPVRPFTLDGNILPVVLVESGIAFVASPTPPYRISEIFTLGLQLQPPINTILSDTGQLPTGSYTVQFVLYSDVSYRWQMQWRNAANTANLWVQELTTGPTNEPRMFKWETRFQVENPNERFRVEGILAVGAGDG